MKFKLKYGLCCLAMVALLGVATSCIEAEKDIPDLEYAYTPVSTTVYNENSVEEGTYGNYAKYYITKGSTATFKALMTPYNVTFPEIEWTSADETIATVSFDLDATVEGTDGVINYGTVTAVGDVGKSVMFTVCPPMNVSNLGTTKTYFYVEVK
ncbi:MAG: Ig-like domain-containing protein [Rikenellaceae bacterium]